MSRRKKISKRRRIFIGCEGESEQGYVALLQLLATELSIPVHLVGVVLQPAGDSLALLVKAELALKKHLARGSFVGRFIFLDDDLVGRSPENDRKALAIADRLDIQLIWQHTCFEALLLRHFEGCERMRPPENDRAMQALQRKWPRYQKATSGRDLRAKISLDEVRRAGIVETRLNILSQLIGLI
jgi:RloB-like protein